MKQSDNFNKRASQVNNGKNIKRTLFKPVIGIATGLLVFVSVAGLNTTMKNNSLNRSLQKSNESINIEQMIEDNSYLEYVREEDKDTFKRYLEISADTSVSANKEKAELAEIIVEKYFYTTFGDGSLTNKFYSNRIIPNVMFPEGTSYRLERNGKILVPTLPDGKYQDSVHVDSEKLIVFGETIHQAVSIIEKEESMGYSKGKVGNRQIKRSPEEVIKMGNIILDSMAQRDNMRSSSFKIGEDFKLIDSNIPIIDINNER